MQIETRVGKNNTIEYRILNSGSNWQRATDANGLTNIMIDGNLLRSEEHDLEEIQAREDLDVDQAQNYSPSTISPRKIVAPVVLTKPILVDDSSKQLVVYEQPEEKDENVKTKTVDEFKNIETPNVEEKVVQEPKVEPVVLQGGDTLAQHESNNAPDNKTIEENTQALEKNTNSIEENSRAINYRPELEEPKTEEHHE